jgi:hypothetical protein
VKTESIDRANATLRRGGRSAFYFLVPFMAIVAVTLLSRGFRTFEFHEMIRLSVTQWLVLIAVGLLFFWMARDARRTSRIRLSVEGIQGIDSDTLIHWSDIAEAAYRSGWLQLQDRAGRRIMINMYYVSRHEVLEAVQDHLPAGVRLRVY